MSRNAKCYKSPETVLRELGIEQPSEIDIEAICQYCGATVVYESLSGSEARIVGYKDRAIITVRQSSQRPRQRFSAGHEFGHWMRDRKTLAFDCKDKLFATEWWKDNPEYRANEYAVELLLPQGMFSPLAKERDITFKTVRDLAEEFTMSLTATAIRLVRLGSFPAVIACYEDGRRRWFKRGDNVPESFWPTDEPGSNTIAHDLIQGGAWERGATEVYADGWFDIEDAGRHTLVEDSVRITPSLVLSLLWWKDEQQLLDLDEDE